MRINNCFFLISILTTIPSLPHHSHLHSHTHPPPHIPLHLLRRRDKNSPKCSPTDKLQPFKVFDGNALIAGSRTPRPLQCGCRRQRLLWLIKSLSFFLCKFEESIPLAFRLSFRIAKIRAGSTYFCLSQHPTSIGCPSVRLRG